MRRSKHYVCHNNLCDFEMYVLSRHDTTKLKCPVDDGSLVTPVKRQDKRHWLTKREV